MQDKRHAMDRLTNIPGAMQVRCRLGAKQAMWRCRVPLLAYKSCCPAKPASPQHQVASRELPLARSWAFHVDGKLLHSKQFPRGLSMVLIAAFLFLLGYLKYNATNDLNSNKEVATLHA